MLIELYIAALVIVLYGIMMTSVIIGFNKLRISTRELPLHYQPKLFLSIVVSARNEEANIERFFNELEKQAYPKELFEILIIDDASEDHTFRAIQHHIKKSVLQITMLQNNAHLGKKKSLAKCIAQAKGSVIITTDADVISRSALWLQSIAFAFEKESPALIIMPIDFEAESGFVSAFQNVENLALTALTAGFVGLQKPFLCNGANLAFQKLAYEQVNGYQTHQHISSGEDVFLLESIKKEFGSSAILYGLSRFLICKTTAEKTWGSLLQQRLRWAYKAKYNTNWLNMSIGILTLLANGLPWVSLVAVFSQAISMPYLVTFVFAKFIFDFLLLFLASDFLGKKLYKRWFFPFQLVYGCYALIVGVGAMFIKPRWKNKPID